MDYIQGNNVVDTFDKNACLSPNANGEEYRLLFSILDMVQHSIAEDRTLPCILAEPGFDFSGRFGRSGPLHFAGEEHMPSGSPDCFYVAERYVMCFEHTKVNASDRRCENGRDNGDEYSVFIRGNEDAFRSDGYPLLERKLADEHIFFRVGNLCQNVQRALERKSAKVSQYCKKVEEYIRSLCDEGRVSQQIAEADLCTPMEVWLLIEDNSPTTSFEAIFSCVAVLDTFERSRLQLAGLIYAHCPNPTKSPQSVSEAAFIHNDDTALEQMRNMAYD